MKVNSIEIKGIAGIKNLNLSFNSGINIICGTNGIGKTTILECIATTFLNGSIKLKRNCLCTDGSVKTDYESNNITDALSYQVLDYEPNSTTSHTSMIKNISDNLLYFKPYRDIEYKSLNSINRDPDYKNNNMYYYSYNATIGISADDIKNWLINRYLFSDKKNSISEVQIDNYNLSLSCFSIMDSNIKFKTVLGSTYEIVLETNKGDIFFEYLSSGYKSAIYILIGIIKEIEYRITKPYINAKDFEGVILIDEIDIHLHPHWQSKLVQALKQIFPKAQIIATTHSPTVLQELEENELIPLEEDIENGVKIKKLNLGKYGLKGWTVEEILSDVMGLPSTSSELYLETMKKFDAAMNDEEREKILHYYGILDEMLHPQNPLRKLLKIQVAEWED